MSAQIIRFPARRQHAILVVEYDGEFFVLRGSHGWLHVSRADALNEARALADDDGTCVVVKP
jgi:hypothetical protein